MNFWKLIIFLLTTPVLAFAQDQNVNSKPPTAETYRSLILNLRKEGRFKIPVLKENISYKMTWGEPILEMPKVADIPGPRQGEFVRLFWDKIFLKDSELVVHGENLPLTCIFVEGQDNRFGGAKPTPITPDFILKVHFVANDFQCGPRLNPPGTSANPERWNSFLYYVVKDPTIMLPTDIKLRYYWDEFTAMLELGN